MITCDTSNQTNDVIPTGKYIRPSSAKQVYIAPLPSFPDINVLPPTSAKSSILRNTTSHSRPFTSISISKMRVPYAPSVPVNEEDVEIYQRIAERRKPRPLIPLDLALLHSPAVADGWNSFIGAIRTKTNLSPNLKELAISRIAVLNHAVHEWDIHAALALKAGVSKEVLQTIFELPVTRHGMVEREGLLGFSKEEYAVMVYTDQMTVGVQVEEQVMDMVKGVLRDDSLVVELTATIAAYNAVSRFLVALDVGECNGRRMKKVEEL